MNSVKSMLYFNRYCSTCGYRYPNTESTCTYDDECVHPDVLDRYINKEYGKERINSLKPLIISVECRTILKFCLGDYYKHEQRTTRNSRKKV